MLAAVEQKLCEEYLRASKDEVPLAASLGQLPSDVTVITMQGFEERTYGVLEVLGRAGVKADRLIIARYINAKGRIDNTNTRQFEALAERVAPGRWTVLNNPNDGTWVQTALQGSSDTLLVDITGASSRAMFRVLDGLADSGRKVYLAYTEAVQYWPRKHEWNQLRTGLSRQRSISDLLERKPWMFGHEHHVELVPRHEGYDASGTGRAIVAFLPYKCSRLAAILGEEDYSERLFIAGRPPSSELAWRADALREINESLTKGGHGRPPLHDIAQWLKREAGRDFMARFTPRTRNRTR